MKPLRRFRPGLSLLFLLFWPAHAALAAPGCSAAIALAPYLIQAADTRTATMPGTVDLTFLGHASFLIQSPGGVSIVTDYNGYIRPDFIPDIVTMNHAHATHYTDYPEPEIKLVLRGWDTGNGIPHHDIRFGDVHIRSVSTNIRHWTDEGTEFGGNSIFVFDIADLCVAHLGHLHHTLTPEHLSELGQIDVLIVPVDGGFTLSHRDIIEVIGQLKPPLIVPMHFFTPRVLELFLERMGDRYPVAHNDGPHVVLSRAALPKTPTILVVPPISPY